MPPTRRPLSALGSLRLVGYANNPSRVITELAFIADGRVNALAEGDQCDLDAPLEIQFEEFMDGVNSRGRGTKTRQRKMTIEQAAAILLLSVQKGHVELITKRDDPDTIDTIKILPEAKKILAAFLPKLRGYGDIPYDLQYRGAIALAKRHFFPKGKAPTKKELMALLLQCHQEKRDLELKYQSKLLTKTLGTQTSCQTINVSSTSTASDGRTTRVRPSPSISTTEIPPQSNLGGNAQLPNDDIVADPTPVTSGLNTDVESHDLVLVPNSELVLRTPKAPKSFNPYMTPISNPRHTDYTTTIPALLHGSPTPATDSHAETPLDEDNQTDERVGEMLQATARSQGLLDYYYNKFVSACQKVTFLEGQREDIQREFDLTKRKLDETEQRLLGANVDRRKLKNWGDSLLRRIESIHKQLGLLSQMTSPEVTVDEEQTMLNPELQEGPDTNSI